MREEIGMKVKRVKLNSNKPISSYIEMTRGNLAIELMHEGHIVAVLLPPNPTPDPLLDDPRFIAEMRRSEQSLAQGLGVPAEIVHAWIDEEEEQESIQRRANRARTTTPKNRRR